MILIAKTDLILRLPLTLLHLHFTLDTLDNHYHALIITWIQHYAGSDWLLRGQDFLVMSGHYETFSRLDNSFELWVKATSS